MYQRNRTRTEDTVTEETYTSKTYWYGSINYVTKSMDPVTRSVAVSSIGDNPRPPHGVKSCYHSKNPNLTLPFTVAGSNTYMAGGWMFGTEVKCEGRYNVQLAPLSLPTPDWGPLLGDLAIALDPNGPVAMRMVTNMYELRQTISTFTGMFKFLKRSVKALASASRSAPLAEILSSKKTKIDAKFLQESTIDGKFTSAVDLGSNVWLGYRYGIKPLVSDLVALVTMSKELHKRLKHINNHRTEWTTVIQRGSKSSFNGNLQAGPFHIDYTEETRPVIGCEARWPDFRMDSEALLSTLWNYVGLEDILTNLWEVTPLSFVLDWAVDVGSMLDRARVSISDLSLSGKVEIRNAWHTISRERLLHTAWAWNTSSEFWAPLNGSVPYILVPKQIRWGLAQQRQKIYVRNADGLPTGWNSPELMQGMSLTHLVDGAFIARQLLKSRVR